MKSVYLFIFQIAFTVFFTRIYAQTTHYVTPNGAGDFSGSSWANAAADLQDAINNASSGDEIWVARGKYLPSQDAFGSYFPFDSRQKTFLLKNGVKLYGGFRGNELFLSERDWANNVTILTGDFADNDSSNFTYISENAYHVVVSVLDTLDTELDGFIVIGGNADSAYTITIENQLIYMYHGGGIYLQGSNTIIKNTHFSANFARQNGGAVYDNGGAISIINATLAGNKTFNATGSSSGGAIFNIYASPIFEQLTLNDNSANFGAGITNVSSDASLSACKFTGNEAIYCGGGIFNNMSSPNIKDTEFNSNHAVEDGGGIYNYDNSNLTVINSLFYGNQAHSGAAISNKNSDPSIYDSKFRLNSAYEGGAIYNENASPTISGSTFSINLAAHIGGAIYSDSSTYQVDNCAFSNNKAADIGGGIANLNSLAEIGNCIFSQNSAAYGGAIANHIGSHAKIINCSIQGNIADYGGGIYNKESDPFIQNCILWGDKMVEIENVLSSPVVSYSIVKGAFTYPGVGNINQNPLFENELNPDGNDDTWLTSDDGLRLLCASPAINAGNPSITTGEDAVAVPTFNDRRDMGAYEGLCVVYENTPPCLTITKDNVKGNQWFEFCDSHGIICSINPNGMDMGTITVTVSDTNNTFFYNNHHFLSRSINLTSSVYGSDSLMPSNYGLRFYHYDAEIGEYNLTVGGQYTAPSFGIDWYENGNGCNLMNYNGATSGFIDSLDVAENDFGFNNNGFYLTFNLNHFTLFAATTTTLSPLVVELLTFKGENIGHNNILNWNIDSESRELRFEIERTNGFVPFRKVGDKKALKYINNTLYYDFIDDKPYVGKNYYRLKWTDINGNIYYSETIIVYFEAGENIILFPNPVENDLNIIIDKPKQTIIISDAMGRQVFHSYNVPDKIDFSNLPEGMYFIKIGDEHGFKIFKK